MNSANRLTMTTMGSVQWLVFLLANALALPVVIGGVFHLNHVEVAELMQRTFFIVGLSSLLQGWLGHRLPLLDGPAGIWLGVFIGVGGLASVQGTDLKLTLQSLEFAMIVSGLILVFTGWIGWFQKLLFLFTPLVTGSYLMVLAIQLSGTFMQGALGISKNQPTPNLLEAMISISIVVLVFSLSTWGRGWFKSFAVLIGIVLGWSAFTFIGYHADAPSITGWFQLPTPFAWGMPVWNGGMMITGILVSFVLMSNTVASINAVQKTISETTNSSSKALNRAGLMGGVTNLLSSVFSTVGMVPLSVAAGFIRMTGQKERRPFLIACGALALFSFFPIVTGFLAQLPGPIAYATLLAAFPTMFGLGLNTVLQEPLDARRMTILGIVISVAVGIMSLPEKFFQVMPTILQNIVGNGLLVGMILSILLELIWKSNKRG
ncbi:purine/pyrimidine permease [Thermoactinomyces sp. DSM 45892]|uniref:purine/pyrimidine permease n=1 Tax=Thermoactinomyces sp. DSM 45892 TaxID=1882753 RepID=UPI000897E728|nr:purine/pyrimidine permease [Thermoactinomyces sp. DSM 45892]SDY53132.1 Xanthine/uracil permease [Thermoactinomyces sp. DSM 45892]